MTLKCNIFTCFVHCTDAGDNVFRISMRLSTFINKDVIGILERLYQFCPGLNLNKNTNFSRNETKVLHSLFCASAETIYLMSMD